MRKIALAGLVVGAAIALGCAGGVESPGKSISPTVTTQAQSAAEEKSKYTPPTADKIKLTVKVLSKQCFGSAGCNVTYRVELSYGDVASLDPTKTYLVTYEVAGVEDGPQVNSLTMTGGTYSAQSEEIASVKSNKTKLTAKVTDISEE